MGERRIRLGRYGLRVGWPTWCLPAVAELLTLPSLKHVLAAIACVGVTYLRMTADPAAFQRHALIPREAVASAEHWEHWER